MHVCVCAQLGFNMGCHISYHIVHNNLKQTEVKLKLNFGLKSLHLCVTGLGLLGHESENVCV